MTRFEREISGQLGEFWKNRAEKEVADAVRKATEDATVDENGVIRWNSNWNCIPDDFCEKLEYAGFKFNREATREARAFEVNVFLEGYRKNYKGPSEEELSEMRSVFGEGSVVINVATGKQIQL